VDHEGVELVGIHWIDLAQDGDGWQTFENEVMNHVPYNAGNLQLFNVHIKLYVWSVNYCFGMSCCQFSGPVELIVQAQHINNKKYSVPTQ
jgi:hypothetical protein